MPLRLSNDLYADDGLAVNVGRLEIDVGDEYYGDY
jgi:hypothetical protein